MLEGILEGMREGMLEGMEKPMEPAARPAHGLWPTSWPTTRETRAGRTAWGVVVALGVAALCVVSLSACQGDTTAPPAPPRPPAPAGVASLAAVPASVYLQAGQEQSLRVEARDSSGVLVASPAVTWRSDAPAVATIDAAGVVRGLAPGNARITATVGTLNALVEVGVTAVAPGAQQWRVARTGNG